MKKLLALVLVFTLMATLFIGFAQAEEEPKELVVAVGTEPLYFTTFSESQSGDNDHVVYYNIYDSLLYYNDEDGSVQPWLVESWEVSEDGLQYAMKLREDVYFHNGTQMTAEDVQFTLDSAKNYPIGSSLLVNYDYTEVVDDFNFIIHMIAPYAPFTKALCARVSPVMSKAYYEEVGLDGYKEAPIGTGAYKLVSVTSGDSIVLEKNENYWGGEPYFDKVTIKTIADVNTQLLALESGDVDVVMGAPVENLSYLSNPDVDWDYVSSNASMIFAFNMIPTCWVHDDLNFRKAVQYAIDKEAINTAVYGDRAEIIDIYGSSTFTSRPEPGSYSTYERDMEKAKEYLEASNYDGREFNVIVPSGTVNEQAAQVIQGTLYELGINMKITAVDSATFFDTVRGTGDFDAQLVVNTSSVFDEDMLFIYFTYEKYDLEAIDYPRGQEMNDTLKAARVEVDDEKRVDMYAQVSSIINEDAYSIYILMDINTIAFRSDLKGVHASPAKYYRFSEWSY